VGGAEAEADVDPAEDENRAGREPPVGRSRREEEPRRASGLRRSMLKGSIED